MNQINKLIREAKKIVLVSHFYPDPDAIMSLYAMQEYIKQLNSKAQVLLVNEGPIEDYLLRLVSLAGNANTHRSQAEIDKKRWRAIFSGPLYKKIKGAELIIFLDNNKLQNFTRALDELKSSLHQVPAKTLVIDHHPQNQDFGLKVNKYIYKKAASTTEIIGDMFLQANLEISSFAVNLISIGLIGDTNRFLFTNNASERTFSLIAKIWDKITVDFFQIYKTLLNLDIKTAKLLGYFFTFLEQDVRRCSYIFLSDKDIHNLQKKGFNLDNIEHAFYFFINTYLLLLNSSEVGIAGYYDVKDKKWYISLRSLKHDMRKIAQAFGGGGHPQAAGFIVNQETKPQNIVKMIEKHLKIVIF